MKKFICLLMVAFMSALSMTSNAQAENSRFFDNMSLTLKGGVTTPIHHNPFWDDMRPVVGLEVMKGVTPVLSLGVEGTWSINTSPEWFGVSNGLVFDRQHVGGLMKLNLMNAFAGNLGTPRVFELGTVVGIGWQHDYFKDFSVNTMYTKFGLDFDFNLGKSKAWSLSFKPDIVFNLGENNIELNRNFAFLEFWGGITYHFKNHDGTRFFPLSDKKYTQSEVDCLNDEINFLRKALKECEEQPKEIITETVIVETEVPVTNTKEIIPVEILFAHNSANLNPFAITELQKFTQEISGANKVITVKGYASVEGNEQYNKDLSLKRAEAVKKVLVENGVNPDMIEIFGFGATSQFGNALAANRIVIVAQ